MALFGASYLPPGTYTSEIFVSQSANAIGTARIPVIIGEGQQYFSFSNVELFRGSSSVQDDQAVNENISDQVTGFTRSFQTTYTPVTDGTGKGIVSNDPTDLQVSSIDSDGNQFPVTVISLNGSTGQFDTQDIIPAGTELLLTYNFKRGDTLISNENLAPQIPSYSSLTVNPGSAGNSIVISVTTPGELGNLITLQFVDRGVGNGVPDAQAVIGAGTDAITIDIRKPGDIIRTLQDLQNLVQNTSIPTLDAGFLTASVITGVASTSLVVTSALAFTGGLGTSSNTVFKVAHTPITDGTNGGIVSTNPANVTVEINGSPIVVTAVDGANGLVTVATPVAAGSTLTITYYTNTWQNTFDLLPASNVASITQVGLGPNRSDFVEGIDYVLGVDSQGNGTINWGASVSAAIGLDQSGDEAFSQQEVNTTLVDDQVYLRPLVGSVNGKNTIFTLPDTPVDGSGLSRTTDNPSLVSVYVGADPLEAFLSGPVTISQLSGANAQVVLYNPPPSGSQVYASYYRSVLQDNEYTLTVATPGFAGLGTYTITDELNRPVPLVTFQSGTVAASAAFGTTGIVYPFGYAGATLFTGDLQSEAGAISETVTLTFRNDGSTTLVPAAQAALTLTFSSTTITFTASQPGAAGNNVQIAIDASSTSPNPVVVAGNLITIFAAWDGTLHTLAQIASYFPSGDTLSGGRITATSTSTSTPTTTAATSLTGGANAVTSPVSHSYIVSSSAGASGSSGIGYLDQTYEDSKTGFRVTIVNPADHVAYGVPSIPASYNFVGSSTATITNVALASNVLTISASNNFVAGQQVTFSGLTTATWLNSQTVSILTASNSAFTASFTHANYASTADTGTASAAGDTLVFSVNRNAVRYTGNPGTAPAQYNNWIALPGLHTKVVSTLGSTIGDTVIVSTFNNSGNNPNVGEYYYVSYTTSKTAADYDLKIYTNPSDAYAQYGQPSTINRLSLGIQLMSQNGVQTFGAIQVPVQPNTNLAASSDYIAALTQVTKHLPGYNRKADVVVPLSNDPTVHQALSRQLITQAGARYKGEAIGFVGYSQFTTSAQASANAVSLSNQRMIAIGNASAGILITDLQTGVAVEYPVDGPFMAAALAGLNCNPSNDVATTLTLQNLIGFSRLLITYDDPTMDAMAASGLTLLLNNNGALQVRHYKTTDPTNDLTSEPTSTTIADYVAQRFRADLQQFIGRKLVDSLVTDITVVCNARLNSLMNNVLIAGYENLTVAVDPNDETTVNVTCTFKPIFSLLYVSVTFVVQTSL